MNNCPLCKKDFDYDEEKDSHLRVDLNNADNIYNEYNVKDFSWPSRLWNKEHTDYIDLSGGIPICPDCLHKRCNAQDVTIDGHRLCSRKGCPNDANEFSKYCYECYDEAYPTYPKSE